MHIGIVGSEDKAIRHRLSDIDSVARLATCSIDGPMTHVNKAREGYWKCSKQIAAYRQANREYFKAYHQKFDKEYKRERRLVDPRIFMLYNVRKRAKAEGLPFNLELKDLIIPEYCPVFPWIKLVSDNSLRCNNSPSVDRINPRNGYTKGNVRVISWRANDLRKNATFEELQSLARDAERLQGKS